MVQDRINKTNRAAFVLHKALSVGQNVSVQLAMTLFEKQLSPILLYGCSLWGIPDRMNYLKIKSDILMDVDNIRKAVINLFHSSGVNFVNDNLLLIRRNRAKNEICIKVTDIACKREILSKLHAVPVSLLIEDFYPKSTVGFEKPHTNFAKFALGVSKYESNTLVLGELGKFPIQLKAIRQSILFWFRLEQGTSNVLLNHAYNECKTNEHEWICNIRDFLYKNGLESMWRNVHSLHRDYVKCKTQQRLEDQYIQNYDTYINEDNIDNLEKCRVIRTCNMGREYKQCEYLNKIESPRVRNIFTRLRIDCNNLNDCRFRSYRFKNQSTNVCTFCPGEIDNVTHLLLHCRHPNIVNERNTFYRKYSEYFDNFVTLSDDEKLCLILNVPHGASGATHVVCTFLKGIYGKSRCTDGGSADL